MLITKDGPIKGMLVTKDGPIKGMLVTKDGPIKGMLVTKDGPIKGMLVTKNGPIKVMLVTKDGPIKGMLVIKDGPIGHSKKFFLEKILQKGAQGSTKVLFFIKTSGRNGDHECLRMTNASYYVIYYKKFRNVMQ